MSGESLLVDGITYSNRQKFETMKLESLLFAISISMFILIFEWYPYFSVDFLRPFSTLLKILLPIILFIFMHNKNYFQIKNHPNLAIYVSLFFIFIVWSLLPSLISDNNAITIVQWSKFLYRFLYLLLFSLALMNLPRIDSLICKFFLFVGLFSIIQYTLLTVLFQIDMAPTMILSSSGSSWSGPFGLLGNQTAQIYVPFGVNGIVKFTGFWIEPSKAGGFMFSLYFLGQLVYSHEKRPIWKICQYSGLLGGLFSFSNAAYFGFSSAIMFKYLFSRNLNTAESNKRIFIIFIAILLLAYALIGRIVVSEYFPNSVILSEVTGARIRFFSNIDDFDFSAGRIDLMIEAFRTIMSNPLGIGLQIPGIGLGDRSSATAPLLWLYYTGLIGLFFLLLREGVVIVSAFISHRMMNVPLAASYLSQAWIVVCFQNLLYGDWMTPYYLTLSAMVVLAPTYLQHYDFSLKLPKSKPKTLPDSCSLVERN